MKLKILKKDICKTQDELVEMTRSFPVDMTEEPDAILIAGEEPDVIDFMIAYNDLDANAAMQSIEKYAEPTIVKNAYTPEYALAKFDEFVKATGGFKDSDIMLDILHNAIHGID